MGIVHAASRAGFRSLGRPLESAWGPIEVRREGLRAKMKIEPREYKEPEAPLNGKQGQPPPHGHWMLKYEEWIGGGGTPSGASSYRRGEIGPVRGAGPLTFAAIYYTSGDLPFARAPIPAPCR